MGSFKSWVDGVFDYFRDDEYYEEDYENGADEEDEESFEHESRGAAKKQKVVPMRAHGNAANQVVVSKPKCFADSEDIGNALKSKKVVVINIEDLDPAEAQRLIDFSAGVVFAFGGHVKQISKYIFIGYLPHVSLSGDLENKDEDGHSWSIV